MKIFLTFFYIGKIKFASGTFGSLAGLVLAFFVLKYLGILSLFLLSILVFVFSIPLIDKYEQQTKTHDDKSIVIDEVAGIFLACSLSALSQNSLINLILAFVFFRLFDITKPSIIGKIDKNVKGGLGVMLDDMLAGLFAGITSWVVYGIFLKLNLNIDLLLRDLF